MNSLPDRQLRSARTHIQQALKMFEDIVERYNQNLRDIRRDVHSVIIEFEDV